MLRVLGKDEERLLEAHIASCADCRRELESLLPVIERFVSWPTDVLRPVALLGERLALRIAEEAGQPREKPPAWRWMEPDWQQVAPGIECKLLAADSERHRVSMLVHLAPGAFYPGHTHASVEELHLLHGELWIDGRRLAAGDYSRGEPSAGDDVVCSPTGCTCLLITSTNDILRDPAATSIDARVLGHSGPR